MSNRRGTPNVSDEEILEAIDRLIEADETIGGGGVAYQQLVDEVGLSERTLQRRLNKLADSGTLEKEWGFDNNRPKRAYVPAERADDESEETQRLMTDGGTRRRDRSGWNPPVADTVAPRCRNCGSQVTKRFARVFGDNDDVVHSCPECGTYADMPRGAANAGGDEQ